MKKRMVKSITLDVLTGKYTANIGTQDEHINIEYLCDDLELMMVNDEKIYKEITENTRRKIESICWGAFVELTNKLLDDYYYGQYVASSEHLKAYIGNDYSILSKLYEKMKKEREEYQQEIKL